MSLLFIHLSNNLFIDSYNYPFINLLISFNLFIYSSMMKISGKENKSNTTGSVVIFRSLFKEELLQTFIILSELPKSTISPYSSIYPFTYLYIHLFNSLSYPSIYLLIHSSINLFIFSSLHIFIYLFMYLSISLFRYSSIHLPIYLSIYPFIHLSIYLSIYSFFHLPIYLSIHLFIFLSIYLSTRV